MGTSVKASCSCGYQAAFPIGGGMHSHRSYSYFPYYCAACGSGIVSVNIANDTPACPWSPSHKISPIGGSYSDRLETQRAQDAHQKAQGMSLLERIGLRAPKQKPEQKQPAIICQWTIMKYWIKLTAARCAERRHCASKIPAAGSIKVSTRGLFYRCFLL